MGVFLQKNRRISLRGQERRRRRTDTVGSSSASYTPLKVILDTNLFLFYACVRVCVSVFSEDENEKKQQRFHT